MTVAATHPSGTQIRNSKFEIRKPPTHPERETENRVWLPFPISCGREGCE